MKSKVSELRKAKKITQEELAKDVGVSRRAIVSIENDQTSPSVDVALRIGRRLDAPVEQIFILTDDPNSPPPPSPKARDRKYLNSYEKKIREYARKDKKGKDSESGTELPEK